MLKNILVLALGLTGLLYLVNSTQNLYNLTDIQYLLVFLAITLGLVLYRRHGQVPESSPLHTLLDSPPKEGEDEIPCYSVPHKVIQTQYGDQALLAGYNERVVPYEGHQTLYDDPVETHRYEEHGIEVQEQQAT